MKRILTFVLLLSLVATLFALAACGGNDTTPTATPTPAAATPTPEAATPTPEPAQPDTPANGRPAPPTSPTTFNGIPHLPMDDGSQADFDNIEPGSRHVIYMPPGLEFPIYMAIGAGIEARATELGFTYQVLAPTLGADVVGQLAMLQDAIFLNPDVIILATHDEYGAAPLVEQAVAQGIMVMKVNSDIPSFPTPIHAVVGYGQRTAQRAVGEFLVEYLDGREVYLGMTMGLPGWHIGERNGGFLEGIAGADNITIVTEMVGNWNVEGGLAAATDMLQAHPHINVMWGGNDNEARGSQMAAAALGRDDIIFVGNGGDTAGLEAIYDGLIHITAATTPFIIGQTAMDVAYGGVTGTFGGGFIDTPAIVAHSGNVLDLLRQTETLFPPPTRDFN